MKIRWEVSDGYAGKSRPHVIEIDDNELMNCDTIDEAIRLIDEYIQNDFDNNISWFIAQSDGELRDDISQLITKSA